MHKTTKNFASQETFLFHTLKKLAINVFSNTITYQYLCPQKQEFKVLTDAEETDGELVVG